MRVSRTHCSEVRLPGLLVLLQRLAWTVALPCPGGVVRSCYVPSMTGRVKVCPGLLALQFRQLASWLCLGSMPCQDQKAGGPYGLHTPEFTASLHLCDAQVFNARHQDLSGEIPSCPTADSSLDTAMCTKELEPQASLPRTNRCQAVRLITRGEILEQGCCGIEIAGALLQRGRV